MYFYQHLDQRAYEENNPFGAVCKSVGQERRVDIIIKSKSRLNVNLLMLIV